MLRINPMILVPKFNKYLKMSRALLYSLERMKALNPLSSLKCFTILLRNLVLPIRTSCSARKSNRNRKKRKNNKLPQPRIAPGISLE